MKTLKSKATIKTKSRTDWERVRREAKKDEPIPHSPEDGPYNPNVGAEVDTYWDKATITHKGKVLRRGRGPQKSPTKERITIRLSPKIVEYFRASGEGWQNRVDAALSEWVENHPKSKKK